MEAILMPAAVAGVVFVVFMLLFQKFSSSTEDIRKQKAIQQIYTTQTTDSNTNNYETQSIIKKGQLYGNNNPLLLIPGVRSTCELLVKSGLWQKRVVFFTIVAAIFTAISYGLKSWGIIGMILAGGVAYYVPRFVLKKKISNRTKRFLDAFPDAIDVISRSVKSGHPLNTAIKMIVENIDGPLGDEFRQVIDETAYGRTLTEALKRMAERVDEPDVNFFVVVLSIQQETGGSLTEILGNLSGIIRKRKMLRAKIRALTSEGRMTAWILGGIPIFEFILLWLMAPEYVSPLFSTTAGNFVLGGAAFLVFLAVWIVNMMVDIEV